MITTDFIPIVGYDSDLYKYKMCVSQPIPSIFAHYHRFLNLLRLLFLPQCYVLQNFIHITTKILLSSIFNFECKMAILDIPFLSEWTSKNFTLSLGIWWKKKMPIFEINTFLFATSYHTNIKLALTIYKSFLLLMEPIDVCHFIFHTSTRKSWKWAKLIFKKRKLI